MDTSSGIRTRACGSKYWRFYYYNDSALLGRGVHEGDWESVQVRLNLNMQPDLVSFEAHDGEETCNWSDAETSFGHPVVYVAAGSHAAYSHRGNYERPTGITDHAEGDGLQLLAPSIERVSDATPWLQWPGRWGDSGAGSLFGGETPRGPAMQGAEWNDPDTWIGDVDDCWMGV